MNRPFPISIYTRRPLTDLQSQIGRGILERSRPCIVARWLDETSAAGHLGRYFEPPLNDIERRTAALEGWIWGSVEGSAPTSSPSQAWVQYPVNRLALVIWFWGHPRHIQTDQRFLR